jgi:predicted transcriptional regulator
MQGAGGKPAGALRISAAARRQLQLTAAIAKQVRQELAKDGYIVVSKEGRKVLYALTVAGRDYLAGLEQPNLGRRTRPAAAVDETTITDELREAQKGFLLLQLLDADGRMLPKGMANRIPRALQTSLGLKPAVANYRREKLAEQGSIRITRTGGSEQYSLTPDGLDYLAASPVHLEHCKFTLKGKALNALITAAREPFRSNRPAASPSSERPAPNHAELSQAVLAEFEELRRERYGHSGLVPIHEVRQRIVASFGPAAGRHDVLDEVILGLWREQRLGIEGISDLGKATSQQLSDGIPGVSGTLFYLETPREQHIAR